MQDSNLLDQSGSYGRSDQRARAEARDRETSNKAAPIWKPSANS